MKYIGLDIRDSDDDVKVTEFIRRIQTEDADKIILFAQNQWFYWIPRIKDIISAVKEKNKKLHVFLGCLNLGNYNFVNMEEEKSYMEIEFWHMWWFSKAASKLLKNGYNTDLARVCMDVEKFKYPFISLNNRPYIERCVMMDLLQKHNLIGKGAVSWNNVELELEPSRFPYEWKYFKPERLTLDWESGKKYVQNDNLPWWKLPEEYTSSFCQLISETTRRSPFFTEKTMIPLFMGKPFLIAGAAGVHVDLLKMGFQLYDEIFDYSFDEVQILEQRYEKLITDNIVRITNLPINELPRVTSILREKLEYNQQLAMKLAFDMELWPQVAKDVIIQYKETGNNICPELISVHDDLMDISGSKVLDSFWVPKYMIQMDEIKLRNKKINELLMRNRTDTKKVILQLGEYEDRR